MCHSICGTFDPKRSAVLFEIQLPGITILFGEGGVEREVTTLDLHLVELDPQPCVIWDNNRCGREMIAKCAIRGTANGLDLRGRAHAGHPD